MSSGLFGCFPHGAAHNQSAIDSILAAVRRQIGAAIAVAPYPKVNVERGLPFQTFFWPVINMILIRRALAHPIDTLAVVFD